MNLGFDPDLKMKQKTRNHTSTGGFIKEENKRGARLVCCFVFCCGVELLFCCLRQPLGFGFGISKQLQYVIKTTQTKIATRIKKNQTGWSFRQQENQAWWLPA